MSIVRERPKPHLLPQYCKACGRCIESCPKHCISMGTEINPATGLIPVTLELDLCNGCGLCITACPEPYGLRTQPGADFVLEDPHALFGPRRAAPEAAPSIPDEHLPLPRVEPLVVKGNYASAIGALIAGCRHFYGYPITPSTEGAELMAKLLPRLQGVFMQAVSETAAVNMMYGCGGAGLRAMTFTSSPGFSLMLEGISYMIGAGLPGVFVNVMRGGPGLGGIGPEQSDIKLACRGLGHGNTQALVLAPSTPQEMLDLTILAFERSFLYRSPVVILSDGYLGQMTGTVRLPEALVKPGLPDWAVYGDRGHRGNLNCSFLLSEPDLEGHNIRLNSKYEAIKAAEQRADLFETGDAEVLLVACNTPGRMAKGAVRDLRAHGIKAGLFRPISLWPFPIDALRPLLTQVRRIVVVEASNGQLEDEMRLAMSHAGVHRPPAIDSVRRFGGILPQQREIVDRVVKGAGITPAREVRA